MRCKYLHIMHPMTFSDLVWQSFWFRLISFAFYSFAFGHSRTFETADMHPFSFQRHRPPRLCSPPDNCASRTSQFSLLYLSETMQNNNVKLTSFFSFSLFTSLFVFFFPFPDLIQSARSLFDVKTDEGAHKNNVILLCELNCLRCTKRRQTCTAPGLQYIRV